jgi:hypothetical protein
MSIGNLKTEGNKGNNFPWQYKMLLGLQGIIDSNTNCCDALTALLEPQMRIPTVTSHTGIGAVPTGTYSFSIANVGSAAGTVNGIVSLPAGVTLNFDAGGVANTLDGISFDATGTTFIVTKITA